MNQENFLLSKRAKALKDDIVFVDLKIDYAFKLIFGTPGNEDLLLLLLDSILPEKHIRSVELASTDQVGDSPLGRKSIYDIRCCAARLSAGSSSSRCSSRGRMTSRTG